jgi:hypothetical protein
MMWDLAERVEDAIVAYLKTQVGDMRVYPSWGVAEQQYPCVVVGAIDDAPISETANFAEPREMKVACAVITEAAPLKAGGVEIMTARDWNAKCRADVVRALARSDLATQVNSTMTPRVFFSMLQLGAMSRSVDEERRRLITTISLDCIATPQED